MTGGIEAKIQVMTPVTTVCYYMWKDYVLCLRELNYYVFSVFDRVHLLMLFVGLRILFRRRR